MKTITATQRGRCGVGGDDEKLELEKQSKEAFINLAMQAFENNMQDHSMEELQEIALEAVVNLQNIVLNNVDRLPPKSVMIVNIYIVVLTSALNVGLSGVALFGSEAIQMQLKNDIRRPLKDATPIEFEDKQGDKE